MLDILQSFDKNWQSSFIHHSCIYYYMQKLKYSLSNDSIFRKYKGWLIGVFAVSLVFFVAGAFTILNFGKDCKPNNFGAFYFVGFVLGEMSFFSALLQSLLFSALIFALAYLCYLNKFLIILSCFIFWYGCYIFSINIFAFITVYGFFNVFLLILLLVAFALLYMAVFSIVLFCYVDKRVNHCDNNVWVWVVILCALSIIELVLITIIKLFIIIIA